MRFLSAIVVIGFCLLARVGYPQAGNLDLTFGGGDGIASILPSDNFLIGVRAIDVDDEGRIVLAGQSEFQPGFNTDFILIRFDEDGQPDANFGAFQQNPMGGYVNISWGPNSFDLATGVDHQFDDRIIIAGTGDVTNFFVIGRYNSTDGSPDASFGDDSKNSILGYPVFTDTNPNGFGTSNAMIIDGQDRILSAGTADGTIALLRISRDGDEYDSSFDNNGILLLPEFLSAFERPADIALKGNQIYVAANVFQTGNQAGFLFLVSDNGELQPFGNSFSNPIATIPSISKPYLIRDLEIFQDQIYVCGFCGDISTGNDVDGFVARFQSDGSLDSQFGSGGVVEFNESGKDTYFTCLGIEDNGRVVVGGSQKNNGTFAHQPFVARFKSNGILDLGYGENGSQLIDSVNGFTDAGVLTPNGDFCLTGIYDGQFSVIRLLGGLDIIVGDINHDGFVNLLDVQPFIDAVLAGVFQVNADINCDGSVNLLDVAPFIDLVIGM